MNARKFATFLLGIDVTKEFQEEFLEDKIKVLSEIGLDTLESEKTINECNQMIEEFDGIPSDRYGIGNEGLNFFVRRG